MASKLKFKPGDRVYDKKYGFGSVLKTDEQNPSFPYLMRYEDGTLIWYKARGVIPAAKAKVLPDSSRKKPLGKPARKPQAKAS